MPKITELTVEINIQKVSCPGVWLCQDGGVSLIVYALGTSYQTCSLPPTFPILFGDKLYFRKSFQQTCALNRICCLLKDESLYCELVQFSETCAADKYIILAQYLGSLSEVLFPPKMCSSDGVDLLMRRSKNYPGILAPKIEIATKVRIDEVWNDDRRPIPCVRAYRACQCSPRSDPRQKAVCHSAEYHRNKCPTATRPCQKLTSRSRSRSRSGGSGSCGSLREPIPDRFRCTNSARARESPSPRMRRRDYCVYNVEVPKGDHAWNSAAGNSNHESDDSERGKEPDRSECNRNEKIVLESRYIDDQRCKKYEEVKPIHNVKHEKNMLTPCVCEICRRYHELFHADST